MSDPCLVGIWTWDFGVAVCFCNCCVPAWEDGSCFAGAWVNGA